MVVLQPGENNKPAGTSFRTTDRNCRWSRAVQNYFTRYVTMRKPDASDEGPYLHNYAAPGSKNIHSWQTWCLHRMTWMVSLLQCCIRPLSLSVPVSLSTKEMASTLLRPNDAKKVKEGQSKKMTIYLLLSNVKAFQTFCEVSLQVWSTKLSTVIIQARSEECVHKLLQSLLHLLSW